MVFPDKSFWIKSSKMQNKKKAFISKMHLNSISTKSLVISISFGSTWEVVSSNIYIYRVLIFEIFDLMLSNWVSFLAYPNLFGIKGFVVVYI
jgi:hypothetical protein